MVYYPPPSPENEWDSDNEEDGLADQSPLEIIWLQVNTFQVAVCPLPGNRYAGARRSLVADIETLKKGGVQDVFVLITDIEMRRCKVHSMLESYSEKGLVPHHYPIDDECLPDVSQCLRLLGDLLFCLQSRRVAIHCMDGRGRSCLVLALLAMMLDRELPPMAAMELVQTQRGPAAIQTVKQYNFIMEFRKNLAESQGHLQQSPQETPSS